MNFNRGLFGVRKWQYAKLDDIDLLCKISIFSGCKIDGLSCLFKTFEMVYRNFNDEMGFFNKH